MNRLKIEDINISEIFYDWCNSPNFYYNEALIDQLAASFIQQGGTCCPLIVVEVPVDERDQTEGKRYELIEGVIQFYAAIRAGEMNSEFTTIQAIVQAQHTGLADQIGLINDIWESKSTAWIQKFTAD